MKRCNWNKAATRLFWGGSCLSTLLVLPHTDAWGRSEFSHVAAGLAAGLLPVMLYSVARAVAPASRRAEASWDYPLVEDIRKKLDADPGREFSPTDFGDLASARRAAVALEALRRRGMAACRRTPRARLYRSSRAS